MSKIKLPDVEAISESAMDNVQSWWSRIPKRRDLVPQRLRQQRHPWRTTAVVAGIAGFSAITGYAILYFADPERGRARRVEARRRAIAGMHRVKGGMRHVKGEVVRVINTSGNGHVSESEMTPLRREAR